MDKLHGTIWDCAAACVCEMQIEVVFECIRHECKELFVCCEMSDTFIVAIGCDAL